MVPDREKDVNPIVTPSTPEWTLDADELGRQLGLALEEAGIDRVEAGRRIAPDVKNKGKIVSRWTNGSGLAIDQFALLFGVMKENEEARDRLLRFAGVDIATLDEIPDEIREIVQALQRARRGGSWDAIDKSIRGVLEATGYLEAREGPVDSGGGGPGERERATGS